MIMCTKHHHDEGRVLYIQRIIPPWGVAPVSGPDKGSLRRWRALVWPVTRRCVEGQGLSPDVRAASLCGASFYAGAAGFPVSPSFLRPPVGPIPGRAEACPAFPLSRFCLSPSVRGPNPRPDGVPPGLLPSAGSFPVVRPWAQSPAGRRAPVSCRSCPSVSLCLPDRCGRLPERCPPLGRLRRRIRSRPEGGMNFN